MIGILICICSVGSLLGFFYSLEWIATQVRRSRRAKQVKVLTRGTAQAFTDWALHHNVLRLPKKEEFGNDSTNKDIPDYYRQEQLFADPARPYHGVCCPIQLRNLTLGSVFNCHSLYAIRPCDLAYVAGSLARILPGLQMALVVQLCDFYTKKELSQILTMMARSHEREANKLTPLIKEELAKRKAARRQEQDKVTLFPARSKSTAEPYKL